MTRNVVARKQSGWKVVYTLPDVCLTPMGSSVVPVPYAVYAELKQSVRVAESVKANGHPVVIYDETVVPRTIGDGAGTRKSVKSGTVEANCYPKTHSSTVSAEKHRVVRHDDENPLPGRAQQQDPYRRHENLVGFSSTCFNRPPGANRMGCDIESNRKRDAGRCSRWTKILFIPDTGDGAWVYSRLS
ncbi:MAG: DUF4150 domain-containing protein [Zoogloeaceae bacterium]|jgi:hypothetical protein|nr:DUF4150 domain-containing protein [Zoogloeaceae bacterium]